MAHVFPSMGTVVSLTVPDSASDSGVLAAVIDTFTAFDSRFSLYSPGSELSALARGETRLPDASEQLRAAYASAVGWRSATSGAFTPHRPDGVIDLDGIVKALALQSAADILESAGIPDWCLNAGGDVVCAGAQADGSPWTIGVVDPADRTALLAALTLGPERPAAATSGISERASTSGRPRPIAHSHRSRSSLPTSRRRMCWPPQSSPAARRSST